MDRWTEQLRPLLGHDDDGAADSRWAVATYWPDWYDGTGVPIIAL